MSGTTENTLTVPAQDGDEADLEVYDFYDRTHNTVVAGNGGRSEESDSRTGPAGCPW